MRQPENGRTANAQHNKLPTITFSGCLNRVNKPAIPSQQKQFSLLQFFSGCLKRAAVFFQPLTHWRTSCFGCIPNKSNPNSALSNTTWRRITRRTAQPWMPTPTLPIKTSPRWKASCLKTFSCKLTAPKCRAKLANYLATIWRANMCAKLKRMKFMCTTKPA